MSDRTMRGPLDGKTTKLLLLALDPAATPGEVDNAALALIRNLRRRYRDGFTFLAELSSQPQPPPEVVNVYGAVRMTFGKYRDRRLRDIPPEYAAETLLQRVLVF